MTEETVTYWAECRSCTWTAAANDHEVRAQMVGKHRLSTGHTVDMSEAPATGTAGASTTADS